MRSKVAQQHAQRKAQQRKQAKKQGQARRPSSRNRSLLPTVEGPPHQGEAPYAGLWPVAFCAINSVSRSC